MSAKGKILMRCDLHKDLIFLPKFNTIIFCGCNGNDILNEITEIKNNLNKRFWRMKKVMWTDIAKTVFT